jgi:hypothetical protein
LQFDNYKRDIIGRWALEKDASIQIEFLASGQYKVFYSGKLEKVRSYDFVYKDEFGNQSTEPLLRIKGPERFENIFAINTLESKKYGILSLMFVSRGKIITFRRTN